MTFIYTLCTATCPVVTPMMSFVQDQLVRDFGAKIAFVSISSVLACRMVLQQRTPISGQFLTCVTV
jgi:hypothetical protein